MLSRLSVRSVIVIILVIGALVLAVVDHNFRSTFGDLAKVGVGGYLGQMLPEAGKRSGDSSQFCLQNFRYILQQYLAHRIQIV
jgi:hypothetical protein